MQVSFFSICVSVHACLAICSLKVVLKYFGGKECMEKIQIICTETLEEGLKLGTFICVCESSVSSVKVVPKSCQLPFLFILAASLI